jgi:hypothetical protein
MTIEQYERLESKIDKLTDKQTEMLVAIGKLKTDNGWLKWSVRGSLAAMITSIVALIKHWQ